MGKLNGFREIRRQDPGYRPRSERLQDFRAVELRLNADTARAQAARCMDCGVPFCHGYGCPLANVIPELNDLVYHDRWHEAVDLLQTTNNFPEITGRVCPALCEAACVLGLHDAPTAVRHIETAIIEEAFARGYMTPRPPARRLDARVAVYGSGPAGLAVADVLNHAGYRVTVFDSAKRPGGILRYGIPDFKLEKWVLDRRLQLMQDEGIVFEMGALLGEDISARYLLSRFDALCLAGGARVARKLAVPGRELKGIHLAMDYLTQQNQKNDGESIPPDEEITARDKIVAVLGGGDTGSDCLGTALRQGARQVIQFEILPKPPPTRSPATPWPLWPHQLRESSSHQEGGERRWSVQTQGFKGDHGRLTTLCGVEVNWTASAEGQPPQMAAIPGTEFTVKMDLVILALGFLGPQKSRLIDDLQVKTDARGNIVVNPDSMSSVPGIFAAGDMARGASLVVHAIADGRRAAAGIIRYLETRQQ